MNNNPNGLPTNNNALNIMNSIHHAFSQLPNVSTRMNQMNPQNFIIQSNNNTAVNNSVQNLPVETNYNVSQPTQIPYQSQNVIQHRFIQSKIADYEKQS